MVSTDLSEAIAILRRKREKLVDQVNRIDMAIVALQEVDIQPEEEVHAPSATEPANGSKPNKGVPIGRGVQSRVRLLLEEYDRPWTVRDIIEVFERRGDPVTSNKPSHAVRTALVMLHKQGKVERTAPGSYRSTRFAPPQQNLSDVFRGPAVG